MALPSPFASEIVSDHQTAAACASYFLIVADFSRSSVFTLNQMNSSSNDGAAALAAASSKGSTMAG